MRYRSRNLFYSHPLREHVRMVRKTMKMLVVALIAAFALSSIAEAAPKKMVRQRAKHSSRVASGASGDTATTGQKPAAKKKTAVAKSPARARANSTAQKPAVKKAPARRPQTTKPH